MASPKLPTRWLQLSLRELLLLSAFCGVACAALKYASGLWEFLLSCSVLLLFMAATVTAVVGRGRLRAAATGLALCLAVYGILFCSTPNARNTNNSPELDFNSGCLPTTKALKPLYEVIVTRTPVTISGGFGGSFGGGGGFSTLQQETPDRSQFLAVGHWLWALLFGYAGMRLALWNYDRREKPREAT